MAKKHHKLSPSGAYRWLTCSPSADFEEKVDTPETSEFAEEGTLAHALFEVLIKYTLGRYSKHTYITILRKLKESEYYSKGMREYMEEFVSFVLARYNLIRKNDKSARIFIEQKLDLSHYIPGGFGTADVLIIGDRTVIMIDLKYGTGVPVSATENEQLKIYALGGIKKYEAFFDIELVELLIYQPRIDNINSWIVDIEDLLDWANVVLIPGALKAYTGQGEYLPGDHCKFCKAKTVCAARTKFMRKLIEANSGKTPNVMTPAQVAEVLKEKAAIKDWLNSIEEYALKQALEKNKKWPGFKLVAGVSRRKITDEKKAADILSLEYEQEEYINTSLKGIGDLEKLLGKTGFTKKLGRLTVKPKGAPALVPSNDPRPALNDPAEIFKNFLNT